MAEAPSKGATLQTDSLLQGTVFFADASWKNSDLPGTTQDRATRLGIYIRENSANRKGCFRLQASTKQQDTAFQAEAKALLLAAKLAKILQVDRPTFLTDNQVLAKTAAARKIDHPLLHWNTRACLAEFFRHTANSSIQVYHISRNLNGEAHKCANQVTRMNLDQPYFKCTNSTHSLGPCPLLSTLQNVQFQDFVIRIALCS